MIAKVFGQHCDVLDIYTAGDGRTMAIIRYDLPWNDSEHAVPVSALRDIQGTLQSEDDYHTWVRETQELRHG